MMSSSTTSGNDSAYQPKRCYDEDCGHSRRHHAGPLGEAHCTVGQCLCPDFWEEPFWDAPEDVYPKASRFWLNTKREEDPAWYHKAGIPYWGTDEWGRRAVTIGFGFLGYITFAYRTCWCNNCHSIREQTYRWIRKGWDNRRHHWREREVIQTVYDPIPDDIKWWTKEER